MTDKWKYLGQGSYNLVYKSADGKEVLKIQKSGGDKTDTPERSVRLWNAINAHVPPPAKIINFKDGTTGWVCPFIDGMQASDKEMAVALIDIYNKTGRIVVDATATKNFVRTPDGQILCVDIGMAIQLERSEEHNLEQVRDKSEVSLKEWDEGLRNNYTPFFINAAKSDPETVNVVKALLLIKEHRPDVYDVSFLKNDPELVKKLAAGYDQQNINLEKKLIIDEYEAQLDQIKQVVLANNTQISPSEKKFIENICLWLSTAIQSNIQNIKNMKMPVQYLAQKADFNTRVNDMLGDLSNKMGKINIPTILRKAINSLFKIFHKEEPFPIANYEKAENIKVQFENAFKHAKDVSLQNAHSGTPTVSDAPKSLDALNTAKDIMKDFKAGVQATRKISSQDPDSDNITESTPSKMPHE